MNANSPAAAIIHQGVLYIPHCGTHVGNCVPLSKTRMTSKEDNPTQYSFPTPERVHTHLKNKSIHPSSLGQGKDASHDEMRATVILMEYKRLYAVESEIRTEDVKLTRTVLVEENSSDNASQQVLKF